VTHADGHETVEELHNGGGAKLTKVDTMKLLKSRGMNAVDVKFTDRAGNKGSKGHTPVVQGVLGPPVIPIRQRPQPKMGDWAPKDTPAPPTPAKMTVRKSKLDPFEPAKGLSPGILTIMDR